MTETDRTLHTSHRKGHISGYYESSDTEKYERVIHDSSFIIPSLLSKPDRSFLQPGHQSLVRRLHSWYGIQFSKAVEIDH